MLYKIGKITTHDGVDKVDNDPARSSYEGFTTSGILRIVNGDNMKVIVTENSVYVLYEVEENVA